MKTFLFQMYPTKSLGPDGFPAHFYQRHWDVCGEDVTAVVLHLLNGDAFEEVNMMFVVLIPKVQNPVSLTQFRLRLGEQ